VTCRRCRDRGYCIQPDPTNAGAFIHGPCPELGCETGQRASRQQEMARLSALFAETKLPEKYRTATLGDFADAPALLQQVEAAIDANRGLVLWGTFGTGKTHLAAAVVRRRLSEGVIGLFIKTPALLNRMRATFDKDSTGPTAAELLAAVKRVPLLVLDDLGVEKTTDWVLETLYEIVDSRYCDGLPLVITTNLTAPELRKQIGKRIASRLAEMCVWIEMNGDDRRAGR
jgi:DNA replication protein DnaC